jgi:hypothetical protein
MTTTLYAEVIQKYYQDLVHSKCSANVSKAARKHFSHLYLLPYAVVIQYLLRCTHGDRQRRAAESLFKGRKCL